jgi:hypothetical protein
MDWLMWIVLALLLIPAVIGMWFLWAAWTNRGGWK